jgi:PmbA protein
VTRTIVGGGTLECYLLGVYSARKLNEKPNGGSTSNLYIKAGETSAEDIIASVTSGLYLTSVSGPGFNTQTGDYSVGASGLWIENGKIAFPVQGITIAGNVKEMFEGIDAVGSDLVFRSGANAPTIRIARMMIAGE